MVAYSFKREFVAPILMGAKAQTIRAPRAGRGRHARRGEQVQLYSAMRTRHCRRLGVATCLEVVPVRLTFSRECGPLVFTVGGERLGADAMEAFAHADGFGQGGGIAVLDMAAFWMATHPPAEGDMLDFTGVLIRWRAFSDPELLAELTAGGRA